MSVVQESYLIDYNMELWEWLQENGNPYGHTLGYVMGDVCAYKIRDIGYAYFSWIDQDNLQIHLAVKGRIRVGELKNAAKIAELLGAENLVYTGGGSAYAELLVKFFNFTDKDGMMFLPLPYTEN